MDHSWPHRAWPADVQRLSSAAAKQLGTHAGQELGGDLPHTAPGEKIALKTHTGTDTLVGVHTHAHTHSAQCEQTHTCRLHATSCASTVARHTEWPSTWSGPARGVAHHVEWPTTWSGPPHGME